MILSNIYSGKDYAVIVEETNEGYKPTAVYEFENAFQIRKFEPFSTFDGALLHALLSMRLNKYFHAPFLVLKCGKICRTNVKLRRLFGIPLTFEYWEIQELFDFTEVYQNWQSEAFSILGERHIVFYRD